MGEPQIPYPSVPESQPTLASSVPLVLNELVAEAVLSQLSAITNMAVEGPSQPGPPHNRDALFFLLPLLIVLSTFLFLILLFLVFVILLRRRRGIRLRDGEGPVDLSRGDLIGGEGGLEGVESRWLESVSESERRAYFRAKDYQLQYPPNSLPTDITLSQFLSIQEKGVAAWSFEPDLEAMHSLLVHARTEITFLPDPSSASSVQSNLPLPKLNEVYYWEVKMFDLPPTTNVAVGLATKPYPSFRLPGHGRFSIAYHSNGDKSYNYPFTSTTFNSVLKEGDVLGIGYRPRTGTVFYTRNGRKMDDAFTGLMNYNLFPTVGADGPCSVHVNLGQAGFVFIEANVKKWGLAPSVGTLAPPPAYGSERGSILLAAGDSRPSSRHQSPLGHVVSSNPPSPGRRPTHRSRRPKHSALATGNLPSSPFSNPEMTPPPPLTPPPPITPIDELSETGAQGNAVAGPGPSSSDRYISPTDMPFHTPTARSDLPPSPPVFESGDEGTSPSRASSNPNPSRNPNHNSNQNQTRSSTTRNRSRSPPPSSGANPFNTPRGIRSSQTHSIVVTAHHHHSSSTSSHKRRGSASRLGLGQGQVNGLGVDEELGQEELADMDGQGQSSRQREINVHPPPDSPMSPNPNPPTPHARDIGMRAFAAGQRERNQQAQRTGRSRGIRLADAADNSDVFDSDTDSISRDGSRQRTRESTLDGSTEPDQDTGREPPAYSPLDSFTYADGVQIDLPTDVVATMLESGALPANYVGGGRRNGREGEGREERRERRRRERQRESGRRNR